jgi:hypothetical protein
MLSALIAPAGLTPGEHADHGDERGSRVGPDRVDHPNIELPEHRRQQREGQHVAHHKGER